MNFLEFEDAGRKMTCRSASSPATPGTMWWWIDISGESQRYTAFRTDPSDTPENLKPRVIAFYEQLLADRARPREFRQPWGRGGAAAKPQPTTAPEDPGVA